MNDQHSDQALPHHTRGIVLHHPLLYDLLVRVLSLGREATYRHRMLAAAQLQPGQRVLDVGCGTGSLALAAARMVGPEGRVLGIDPSRKMVARARAKAKDTASVHFEVGVIEQLDIAERSFDVVLSTLVFHHLPDDLKRAGLAEIRRVLVSAGRLVLVDFGDLEPLVSDVESAGFATVRVERLRPRMFSALIATVAS